MRRPELAPARRGSPHADQADATRRGLIGGSRLHDEEYRARAEDLAHNEGDEQFRFAPRRSWDD